MGLDSHGGGWLAALCTGKPRVCAGSPHYTWPPGTRHWLTVPCGGRAGSLTPGCLPAPHPCRRTGVDSLTGTGGPGAVSAGNVSLSAAGMETSCLLPQADSHKCTKEDRAARHQDTRGCGGVSQGSRRSHAECLSQTGFLSDPGE